MGKLNSEGYHITNSLIVAVPVQIFYKDSRQVTMDYLNASNRIITVRKSALYEQIANHYLSFSDLWILLATALVYSMHLGFATLESVLRLFQMVRRSLLDRHPNGTLLKGWRPIWLPKN